jgi:AcrR family transcriptional regulator
MEALMAKAATVQVKEGRRAILDAAARLLSSGGYASISLRDIADAAGMKAGSIYYHFSSKNEIVAEVIELGVRAVAEEVSRELEQVPNECAAVRLRIAIRGHLSALLRQHAYASANIRIYNELPEELRRRTHAARAQYDNMWRKLVAEYVAEGKLRDAVDPKMLRLLLIGAMNSTLEWYRPGGRLPIDALATSFAEIVLNGASADSRAEALRVTSLKPGR